MATAEYNLGARRKSRDSREEEFLVEPLDLMRVNIPSKDKLVPALHVGFMEPKVYVSYVPLSSLILPCIIKSSQADEEEWVERMKWLEEDFTWLLKLPHHRFWSQVVYDENLQICLQTYLSHAPRCYEINFAAHEELLSRQSKMHKLVFLIFLRMSTYKESKLHHISPNVFGDLIYNNFLFDIPRMMDLCVLYGFKNQVLVSKMISNLFTTQPKYMEDLDEACITTLMAFDAVEQQLQNLNFDNDSLGSKTKGKTCSLIASTTLFELLDIVNYITDISATLYMFLECYSDACMTFLKHGAATRIPHFYDSILTDVQNDVEARMNGEQDEILDMAAEQLTLSKTFFIRAFRNIVGSCIQLILNARCSNSDDFVHLSHLESYLQVLGDISIGTTFKYDYNHQFPVEEDIKLFADHGIQIDTHKIVGILDSIGIEGSKHLLNSISAHANAISINHKTTVPVNKSITNLQDLAASLSSSSSNTEVQSSEGACPPKPEESIILSLITNVQDIFPLGDGFIESCLEYYNYDSEKVIDALLSDETLPGHLDKLDREMKRKSTNENESAPSVLDERKNIFDHDEFDIFHNENVPMDRINFGKSNKTPSIYEVLGDSNDSAILKKLTLKYSEENENDESAHKMYLNLYEDEYDDTYDSVEFSMPEAEAELELLTVRPFTTPRVLASFKKDALEIDRLSQKNKSKDTEVSERNGRYDDDDNEKETDEVSHESKPPRKMDDFCENPELQRQRYQQKREAQYQNRHRNFNPRGSEIENKSENPGYRNKERHKSNIGNHNRRKQHDYKRSRGMVPQ